MLRVSSLLRRGRWGVAVVAVAVAVGGTLLGSLASASENPLPPLNTVNFSTLNAHRPVAGHLFEGLAIINRTGLSRAPEGFLAVRCDAEIGGKRLRARHLVYGELRHNYVQVTVCGWLIPADTAGKTLRFWKKNTSWHRPAAVAELPGETDYSNEYTWRVTNR